MDRVSFNSVLDAVSRIQYEQILHILIILVVGILLLRVVRLLLRKTLLKKANQQNQMLFVKLLNFTGFTILLIFVLSELGLQLGTILGAAGVLGIAVGVASQKSLGNIISGFFMVTEKSFEIGDVIKVGEKIGIVYSVELLSIMLKTFDNLLIRIPHETLISTDIINITRFPIRRMDLFMTVSYDDDLSRIMDILKDTARNNVLCLDEPDPFLLVKGFEESGLRIQYGIWFEKNNYVEVRNSLMADILNNFRKEGIRIPYPHMTVNGDLQTLQAENKPEKTP